MSIGQTADIDIVVNAVPNTVQSSGNGPNIIGVDMDLHYNSAAVNVTAKTTAPSIYYAGTGTVPFSGTDSVPDSNGDFSIGEIDNGPIGESGPGILIRLTLTAVGNGQSPLHLDYVLGGTGPNLYDHSGGQNIYTIGNTPDSLIVVGGVCPSPAGGAAVAAARQEPRSQAGVANSNVVIDANAEPKALPRTGGPLGDKFGTVAFVIAVIGGELLLLMAAAGIALRRRLK
jgi:hypothetical protein